MGTLKFMWRDLRETLTPSGMVQFLSSHRFSLAITGAFTLVGLLLHVSVSVVKFQAPFFKLVEDFEVRTLDTRFLVRGQRKVDPRIAIVAIDQKIFETYGFPFARFRYAQMLDTVCGDGARSVGFDVAYAFRDPSSPGNVLKGLETEMKRLGQNPDPQVFEKMKSFAEDADSDTQFAAAMKRCGNVTLGHFFYAEEGGQEGVDQQSIKEYNDILAYQAYPQVRPVTQGERFRFFVAHPEHQEQQFDGKGVLPNLRMFAETAKYAGFFNFFAETDGTYRRAPLIMRYPEKVRTTLKEENFFPSLAVQTTREYLKAGPDDTIFYFNANGPEHLVMANKNISVDISGEVLINYAGAAKSYPTYSFSDVAERKTPPGTFKDKIVYVGATAVGIGDIRPIPYQKQGYPGVEIHANVTDNILQDNFLKRGFPEEITDLWVLLLFGGVMGMVFVVMRPSLSWVAFLFAAACLLGFVYSEFRFHSRWLNLVIPGFTLACNFVGVTTYRVIFEEREKRKVRGAFGMYVHPGLIGQMMKNPGLLRLGGEEVEMTVMFSDVRGFTSISEKLTPTELVHLLNEYLTVMSDIIMTTWGTVDKYEGDAIMAFWGRPYPQPDHAFRACQACLAMIDGLVDLNAKLKSEGKAPLNIGVGLNTGPMVVGNMGSLKRFNYTVMGDSVNLGSRLEGQNKEYGTHIIISEMTYQHVKEQFVCRDLDLIRVKGKMKPVGIYELLAPIEEHSKWEPLVKVFREGLKLYRAGHFEKALEVFEDILSAYPSDGPSKLFAGRCKMYLSEPPVGVWDGVFTATSK